MVWFGSTRIRKLLFGRIWLDYTSLDRFWISSWMKVRLDYRGQVVSGVCGTWYTWVGSIVRFIYFLAYVAICCNGVMLPTVQ
ncbi:hypothetical protein QBC46DRAFT_282566, partial [Diplogelasinospora grovesii]